MRALQAAWELGRPRLAPFVLALVGLGFGWAHWDRALTLRGHTHLPVLLGAWTLLHLGTMWLNAALDRDEGEVLLGRSVPVPPWLARAGHGALAAALLTGWWGGLPPLALAALALSVALAEAYSWPAAPAKAHPVGGPAVNLLGYGVLSPLAGWSVVGVAPNVRTGAVAALVVLGVAGVYWMAQAFQGPEDRARGYRTLVATHGPAVTLTAARAGLGAAFLGGLVLVALGWLPRGCAPGLLGGVVVDRWLAAWAREPDGGRAWHAVGLARRLGASVLLVTLGATGHYVADSLAMRPVAGLGTVAGHPPDRPRLPPPLLVHWERQTLDERSHRP